MENEKWKMDNGASLTLSSPTLVLGCEVVLRRFCDFVFALFVFSCFRVFVFSGFRVFCFRYRLNFALSLCGVELRFRGSADTLPAAIQYQNKELVGWRIGESCGQMEVIRRRVLYALHRLNMVPSDLSWVVANSFMYHAVFHNAKGAIPKVDRHLRVQKQTRSRLSTGVCAAPTWW